MLRRSRTIIIIRYGTTLSGESLGVKGRQLDTEAQLSRDMETLSLIKEELDVNKEELGLLRTRRAK